MTKKKKKTRAIFFKKFFYVGSPPSLEPNPRLELSTLRLRPELRSRDDRLTA